MIEYCVLASSPFCTMSLSGLTTRERTIGELPIRSPGAFIIARGMVRRAVSESTKTMLGVITRGCAELAGGNAAVGWGVLGVTDEEFVGELIELAGGADEPSPVDGAGAGPGGAGVGAGDPVRNDNVAPVDVPSLLVAETR